MSAIVILGASTQPQRYAHRAQQQLMAAGYTVLPVNPRHHEVLGRTCYPDIDALPADSAIAAVTLYVNPQRLAALLPQLLARPPGVVISNPGSEAPETLAELEAAGSTIIYGCTLVMLASGTFGPAVGLEG